MADTFIDYDSKVQSALRSVVRSVLIDTEKEGLAGDHHFYIAFKTQADGVMIPDHLISRFPDEMTIVLQHKYWGLKVFDDYFEIGLSFNQTPEHLTIPFAAVTGFVDPSVQFALQFHDDNGSANTVEGNNESIFPSDATSAFPTNVTNEDAKASTSQDSNANEHTAKAMVADTDDDDSKKDENNVVTLDAFRKK
ncbi:SspB family protein [Kordiimonas sp. SCSIO 12610]|uniref:SspB family protein n=1 Tax=Kordiimonas sp. SCSIO 12610 TaxID=2829597 RepID=UPI0021090D22|nr:ClpXP protease specificity-enhancing factor SspB [Kordiimonas sp. SCSIO 12610]UTW54434.1 hypothetical protein KFF44_11520 [Kordiimonas sp. SCSIO 12610]